MNFDDLSQFDTELTADAVQWRPSVNQSINQLACATYFLNKESGQRTGRIHLLELDKETHFKPIRHVDFEQSGVLDMQWLNDNLMLTLDSSDTLALLKFDDDRFVSNQNVCLSRPESDAVGLAFDFVKCPSSEPNGSVKVLSSNSKGKLNLVECIDDASFDVSRTIDADDYEIWSVKFDDYNQNVFFSGSDYGDAMFKLWDLRLNTERCTQKSNFFNGGVCSIIQSHTNEAHVLCGSYDEQIYLIDKRNLKTFVKKSDKFGGGVWKMRVNTRQNLILTACMHKGAYLVDFDSLTSKLFYDKHGIDTVVYGCDWMRNDIDRQSDLIATCAFYSHELRLWRLNYVSSF